MIQLIRDIERVRDRFLAINILPRGDRFANRVGSAVGGLGVEINGIFGIRKRRVQVRGPP